MYMEDSTYFKYMFSIQLLEPVFYIKKKCYELTPSISILVFLFSQSHSNILCVGKCFTKTGIFSAARVNPPSTLEKCLKGLKEYLGAHGSVPVSGHLMLILYLRVQNNAEIYVKTMKFI